MLNISIVLIPVYKSAPDKHELLSFNQCLKVLSKYPICIFTYQDIEISKYTELLKNAKVQYSVEYFEKRYFENISGYNRLMLSKEFYERFNKFAYMLIYQLDAWVFRDDLEYWCSMNYDYIGAPWFENYGEHENGNKLWTVGNGGFSLRKIESFLNVLNYKKPLYTLGELKKMYQLEKTLYRKVARIVKIYVKSVGIRNNSNHFSKNYLENEDVFWCINIQKSRMPLKKPDCREAIQFSFEKSPQYLFSLNNDMLPFGCHAWEKYDFDTFWKKFIIENDDSKIIYNNNQPQ